MTNCKHCDKPLTHVEGRKQKSFCNVNCRNKYFYAQRQKLIKSAMEMTNGNSHAEIQDEPKEPTTNSIQSIQQQISDIRSEKIPSYISTPIGRKVWEKDQEKKINELKKQLT